MFDEQQSTKREFDLTQPLIVIACAGGGVLLSFGLCGAAAAIPGGYSSSLSTGLGISGLIVLGFSVFAIIIAFLWLAAAAIINTFRS